MALKKIVFYFYLLNTIQYGRRITCYKSLNCFTDLFQESKLPWPYVNRCWCDSDSTLSHGLHKHLVTVLHFSIINVLCRTGRDASFAYQANLVILLLFLLLLLLSLQLFLLLLSLLLRWLLLMMLVILHCCCCYFSYSYCSCCCFLLLQDLAADGAARARDQQTKSDCAESVLTPEKSKAAARLSVIRQLL